MGSTLYTSEDTSAPELRPENGSLLNLLKKVLVEGYGDKEPLGWELVWEDPARYIAVFRMPTGSRTYFKIIDDGSSSTWNAQINAYETMSNIDTGIHPCIPETEATYKWMRKSHNTTNVQVVWRIVGDELGFYYVPKPYQVVGVEPTLAQYMNGQVWYIGDYVPYRQEDRNNFVINAATTTAANCQFNPTPGIAATAGMRVMRDFNNERNSVTCGMGSSTGYHTSRFGNNVDLSPLAGRFMYLPVTIHTPTYGLLGVMPGLMHPLYLFPNPVTIADTQEFYESDSSGIWGISLTTSYSTASTNYQRILLRIGDSFRDAY